MFTQLNQAAARGNLEEVKDLLQQGTDVDLQDSWGATALLIASRWGNLPVIEYLLEAGAEINRQDQYGSTALMEAISWSRLPEVVTLLAHRALVNLEDSDGRTALDLARARKDCSPVNREIAELLEKAHGRYTKLAKR